MDPDDSRQVSGTCVGVEAGRGWGGTERGWQEITSRVIKGSETKGFSCVGWGMPKNPYTETEAGFSQVLGQSGL